MCTTWAIKCNFSKYSAYNVCWLRAKVIGETVSMYVIVVLKLLCVILHAFLLYIYFDTEKYDMNR